MKKAIVTNGKKYFDRLVDNKNNKLQPGFRCVERESRCGASNKSNN